MFVCLSWAEVGTVPAQDCPHPDTNCKFKGSPSVSIIQIHPVKPLHAFSYFYTNFITLPL